MSDLPGWVAHVHRQLYEIETYGIAEIYIGKEDILNSLPYLYQ